MHIITSIGFVIGAMVVLAWGAVSVFRDLVARGPHDAPTMDEELSPWPRRLADASATANAAHAATSTWSTERESG